MFATDEGLETTLVFHHGIDLPPCTPIVGGGCSGIDQRHVGTTGAAPA